MILHSFSKDYDESKCYCDCAQEVAVFSPSRLIIPSTLNLTDFTFIMRDYGKGL